MNDLVDLRTLQPERKHQAENVEIGHNEISLDLLRAVYRANHLPLTTRMRAAMAALKHEVPTLGVSFVVNDADIADRLDRAIARIANAERKTISGNAITTDRTIEPEPRPSPPLPAPLNRVYSSRFRRI